MRQLPRILILLFALVAVIAQAARADEAAFGVTKEWVRDDAHVLTASEKQRLEEIVRNLQQKAGYQLIVLTLPTLNGEDPNHAATRYGNEMRAGREKADTGVVMLLAMKERQFYIATGKGTGAVLPDSLAGGISRNVVRPYLKEGKFGDALIAGAIRISQTLEGGEDATPWPADGGSGKASGGRGLGPLGIILGIIGFFGGFVPLLIIAIIVGLIVHATRTAKKCPRCGHMLDVTEHVVKSATTWKAGYGYRERHCPNCGYKDRQRYTIPRRGGGFYGGPFIGGGWGGGSSGGWGGGSSGGWGGGSSGGWGGGGGGFSGGGGGFGGGGGGTSW